jgi:hypothetical protein
MIETENKAIETELTEKDQNAAKDDTIDKDKEWDRHRQELDIERANARKAREELSAVSELYDSASDRVNNLESQLEQLKTSNDQERARLKTEQQNEQDKLDEMDPEIVDEKVIRNIKAIEKRLLSQSQEFAKREETLMGQIKDLSQKTSRYEQEKAEAKQRSEHEKAVESVLNEVEDSLKDLHGVGTPGQYRTEAMKIADDLVDKGERKRPGNILEGIKLMRECYVKVISAHQKKKSVSVDGGKSGVTPGVKAGQRKTGSLDEVAADMLKDKSWQKGED